MKNYVNNNLIVIRGGGDLGTGVAFTLFNAGFNVVILEITNPIAVRRKVAFSEAIFEKMVTVEGITAIFTEKSKDIAKIIGNNNICVLIDEEARTLPKLKPFALIDAIVAKKNFGTNKSLAPITIALGPGFVAGIDVDAVIETNRGENLGGVIYEGTTSANTGLPAPVMGFRRERVLWAPVGGHINAVKDIGEIVIAGDVVAEINGFKIKSKIDGFVRGMVHSGIYLREGLKVADIDPRLDRMNLCYKISDKALLLGKSALKAIKELKDVNIQKKKIEWTYAI